MIVSGHGLALDAPPGWDVRIVCEPEGGLACLHAASFALPRRLGGFGGEAIDAMPDDGLVFTVLEYEPAFSRDPLFARGRGLGGFRLRDLDPAALTRGRPRRAGAQSFGVAAGRPLCVYLVVGVFPSPARLVRQANRALRSLRVAPRDGR